MADRMPEKCQIECNLGQIKGQNKYIYIYMSEIESVGEDHSKEVMSLAG
jgi:hypothetical protein